MKQVLSLVRERKNSYYFSSSWAIPLVSNVLCLYATILLSDSSRHNRIHSANTGRSSGARRICTTFEFIARCTIGMEIL